MKAQPLTVFLPDTRGVSISRFGIGNLKIGMGVYTYSRRAGREGGTCPGSTDECEQICYAKRITGVILPLVYDVNSASEHVPEIPPECRILRIHVSGDFTSEIYIESWIARIAARPDVTVWAYTRSWRVTSLVPALERLRALPNMQLFASMDPSCLERPPAGWRRAWIERSFDKAVSSHLPMEDRLLNILTDNGGEDVRLQLTDDNVSSYICPEETGHKPNCLACGYCFEGRKNDVTFLEH